MTLDQQMVSNDRRLSTIDAEYHLGLIRNDVSKAAQNLSFLQDGIDGILAYTDRYEINFGQGDFFFSDEISLPACVGLTLRGAGKGYQLGETDYATSPFAGSVTRLIGIGGTNKAVIRSLASHFTLTDLQLQGQRIPTNGSSGTGTRTTYGLVISGSDGPPTGKATINSVSAVNCTTAFACLATPSEAHADSTLWTDCHCQGCETLFYSNNQQALNHTWISPQVTSYASSPLLTAFEIEKGGYLNVFGLEMDTYKARILKIHDDAANRNTNYFRFHGVRYDTPTAASPQLTLVEFAGTADPSIQFNIAMDGLIANVPADTFEFDPDDLLIGFDTEPLMQSRLRFNFVNMEQSDPGFAARFSPEPFPLTTTERDAISAYKRPGLTIYNTTTNKLNFWNGSSWQAVTSA